MMWWKVNVDRIIHETEWVEARTQPEACEKAELLVAGKYPADEYRVVSWQEHPSDEVDRKIKARTQLKERGSVDCACGQVITPATPYVDVEADGVLWHGNAQGGGHRADVEP